MELSQSAIIALLALVLVGALLLWFLYRQRRTAALRDRFGEEYDRTLDDRGGRGKAEADLTEREERVADLDIRPLGPAERERFTGEWRETKTLFVDAPAEAVLRADRLLGEVMGARGYPVTDFDERFEALTVDHGDVARHYRAGHEVAERQGRGEASTEDLRQAMIHYEALFDELVDDRDDAETARPVTAPAVASA